MLLGGGEVYRQKAGWGWLDSGIRLEQNLRECAGKGGSMTHEMLIAWKNGV